MSNDTETNYWASVRVAADDAAESIREHGQDACDALFEACDGSYWTIYYHAAGAMLQWSPNDDAIFDECGPQTFDSYGDACTKMAAWAYFADVRDYFFETYDESGVRLDGEGEDAT